MRPASPDEELRWIEGCIVAPDERRPGRTYERVQELLLEVYTLRQLAGLSGHQTGSVGSGVIVHDES